MAEQFDPYRKWLGIPDQPQHPHHYQLLGLVLFEDDPDVIENAANRQMTHVRSFQTGQYASYSQDLLNEIAKAKICLLQPDSKASYDLQLQTKLNATTPQPGIDPMTPVVATAIPVAVAANAEVATPVRATVSTEQATPVRPDNPLKELSSQITIGTKTVSHRARSRKSNAGLPWLMALGALVGVGLLIVPIMFQFDFGGRYKAAEKTYLRACDKYNAEMSHALDVADAGRSRRAFTSEFLSAGEKLAELTKESKQIMEMQSDAKAKYEKAYSIFSKICSDLGKPPPDKLMTL